MARPDPCWQLIGTLWPLAGFGLAVIASLLTTGAWRWRILYAGPLLVIMPCYIYADVIAYDGNMLFAVFSCYP